MRKVKVFVGTKKNPSYKIITQYFDYKTNLWVNWPEDSEAEWINKENEVKYNNAVKSQEARRNGKFD